MVLDVPTLHGTGPMDQHDGHDHVIVQQTCTVCHFFKKFLCAAAATIVIHDRNWLCLVVRLHHHQTPDKCDAPRCTMATTGNYERLVCLQ
jgi:hypothetical protein